MKNRYFFNGVVVDGITGDKKEFSYRQLTADNISATSAEGIMYEHKGERVIETDAIFPFQPRQKVICHDGRSMTIIAVQYITRTLNTPASRYSIPGKVAIISLG